MSKTITQKEKCYRCGGAIEFWEIQCGACGSEVPKGPRDTPQTTQLSMEAYNAEMKRRLDDMPMGARQGKFIGQPMQDNATIIPNQAADQRQVDGKHYKDLKVQPWSVMEAILSTDEFIGYLKGCIIKYGMRQDRKDTSPEDGEKCRHYIQKLNEINKERSHNVMEREYKAYIDGKDN